MKQPIASPSEHRLSTPEERLQHDIEELESGSGWRGVVRFLAIVAVALVVVGALYYTASLKKPAPPPRLSSSGTFIIETQAPPRAKLDVPPTTFRWESISGRSDYLFQILQQGNPTAVVERPVRENSTVLSSDEAARLVKGTTYIWVVEARGTDGKIMGSGRGWFDL